MPNQRPELTEAQFTEQVLELAALYGWVGRHERLSLYAKRGWPDWVFAYQVEDGEPARVIFAELKRESKEQTAEQHYWLQVLQCAGIEAYLWRPSDLEGEILDTLSARGNRWGESDRQVICRVLKAGRPE